MEDAKDTVRDFQTALNDAKTKVDNVSKMPIENAQAVEGIQIAMVNIKGAVSDAPAALQGIREAVESVRIAVATVEEKVQEDVNELKELSSLIDEAVENVQKAVGVKEQIGVLIPVVNIKTAVARGKAVLMNVQEAARGVQAVVENYIQEKVQNEKQVDDVEAAGFILGKMVEVVVHKLK